MSHDLTQSSLSWAIWYHRNDCFNLSRVFFCPRWPAVFMSCHPCKTHSFKEAGTRRHNPLSDLSSHLWYISPSKIAIQGRYIQMERVAGPWSLNSESLGSWADSINCKMGQRSLSSSCRFRSSLDVYWLTQFTIGWYVQYGMVASGSSLDESSWLQYGMVASRSSLEESSRSEALGPWWCPSNSGFTIMCVAIDRGRGPLIVTHRVYLG